MAADFHDAHNRHWDDAELLYESERWANADQLYGLSAECGLKRLMMAFGMQIDPAKDWPQDRADRVHANGCWVRYETYRSGIYSGANYSLPPLDPFGNWDISQRYENQSCFSEDYVTPHKSGADEIHKLIKKAVLEGII